MKSSTSAGLTRAVKASAFVAIVCGVSGIAGWVFGIRELLSIVEDAPALMPLSAIGLLVAGASLACTPYAPRVSRLLGVLVAMIALLASFGYLIGSDLGFGNLPADLARGAGTLPGLPAPNSILGLALLAVALVMLRQMPLLAQTMAILAGAVAYLGGVGELFGATRLEGLSAYTAMSPQTVLAMCALAVGILCATPERGVMVLLMDRGVAGLAVRRFLPIAVLLPVVMGGLRVAGEASGLFDTSFGTALMAVASAALAGVLTVDIALAIRQLDQKLAREGSARAVAESESRVKDEVLALLTRELRTPAGVIHAQAHLLQTGLLTGERVQKAIETMSLNAARLRQYVDDVVEVAAMAHGGVLIEPGHVDPREPVRHAIETWVQHISSKNIALTTELTPVGFVNGDPARLQQIVSNLLSNAVKFTPPGGAIRVEVARDADTAQISVADTGCGIAREFLPHMFESFRRSPSLDDAGEGLGLGLTIVRHLVELHGGTVTAYSDGPGRGARFVVRLPATPDAHRSS